MDEVTIALLRKRLKTKALNAWDAYRCCIGGKLEAQKFLLDLADKIGTAFQTRTVEALCPVGRPLVKVKFPISSTRYVFGFFTPDETESELGWMTLPANQPELDRVLTPLKVAAEQIRKSETDCLDCIEKRQLSQRQRRKNVLVRISRRVG